MNIWVLDSRKGVNLLFKSFLQIPVDKDIVSGLLTAFNQFTTLEFNQPIESIEMGGMRWIYASEPNLDLLFVASDTKDIKVATLSARLKIIKECFLSEFSELWKVRGNKWEGNLEVFSPFEDVIENFYFQWKDAEIMTSLADFFDLIGVFQEILNKLRKVIEDRLLPENRALFYDSIQKIFDDFHNQPEIINDLELKKISFTKVTGFNIININPTNCDPLVVKKNLKLIMMKVIETFKNLLGGEIALLYFKEGGIFDYIYENIEYLKNLKIDHFLLKLILSEKKENISLN